MQFHPDYALCYQHKTDVPCSMGTGVGAWDFGGRIKKSTDYPPSSWQHALLARDEGNPAPLKAYRARFSK